MNRKTRNNRKTIFRKWLCLSVVFLLLVSSFPLCAGAEAGEKPVRVGYFTMENFMEGGADGSPQSGLSYELICEIAVYNHWNVEFVYGEFGDLYQLLAEGELDLLPNIIDTDARKEQVLFHDFMLNEEHYYLSTLRENLPEEATGESLNGKRLATVKDAYEETIFDAWAKENGLSMEKVYCGGFDEAWQLVRDGRADYILNINNTSPTSGFASLCEVGRHGVYFAVAKEREDILADIDNGLKIIDDVSPFLIDNLKQKYLNNSLSSYQLSKEEKEWLAGRTVLRIGGLVNDVPYTYEQDGRVVGTYVELTEMILKKLTVDSLKVEWSLYPTLVELRAALKNGELDLICPEYHSYFEAERNGFVLSETIVNIPMGILSPGPVRNDGIASIAVGKARPGYVYLQEAFPEAEAVPVDSMDDLVKAVADGKATVGVAHIYALQTAIRGSKTEYTISPLSAPCPVSYAAMKKDHAVIMMMDRGYHLIDAAERNSVELRYVAEKTESESVRDFLRKNMPIIVLVLLSLLAVVAFAINRSVNAEKVKKNLAEITRQNEIIEASRRDLEKAKEEAQSASRAKSTFLFNMSHDIRTPMNAIIGFNSMAINHLGEPDKVKDCLGKINVSSKHLLSLINDVLDMARIESGAVKCEYEPISLSRSAAELIDIVRESMEKSLSIETDFSGITHDFVLADHLHVDRIIMNVISNSVKYTPEGGTVRFVIRETSAAGEEKYGYDFILSDNGIGMSKEFLDHIYEEFSRERTSTLSGVQGTGLGMAITKKLVDLLGGSIKIESELGEGTVTTVHLEMEAADAGTVTAASDGERADEEVLKGKRVLLVEDNELNREIAADILTDLGMTVDMAEDGDIAVKKAADADKKYDIVLMDIQMPRMNGYEATRAIRALPGEAANVPIVAMTANAFEEDKQNALDVGMNGHTAKPIDVAKLTGLMARLLK